MVSAVGYIPRGVEKAALPDTVRRTLVGLRREDLRPEFGILQRHAEHIPADDGDR